MMEGQRCKAVHTTPVVMAIQYGITLFGPVQVFNYVAFYYAQTVRELSSYVEMRTCPSRFEPVQTMFLTESQHSVSVLLARCRFNWYLESTKKTD